MKILVLNCGSSSLKYQLLDMKTEKLLVKGNYQRIGEKAAFLEHKVNGNKYVITKYVNNHEEALDVVLGELLNKEYAVINDLKEIDGIGHRIVHGGEIFKGSVVITDEVIKDIEKCACFAPLHNLAAVSGIKACIKIMPNIPMVAVFDTAFHQTMPKERYMYPIPLKYYEKYGVRKYGAHGTSHDFVSKRLAEILNKNRKELNIVTCHLGQGASLCAIKDGMCIDTSMGLTPLGGIAMVTRSGDLDPSVVTYIMEKENITPQEMTSILNKESGISAIANMVPDFREIEETAYVTQSEYANLAVDKFVITVSEYIARYAVVMEGIDNIIFTGGIGENQTRVREQICNKLKCLGVEIDIEKNKIKGEEVCISSNNSKVSVYIIPTNEELEIAKETVKLIRIKGE